MNNAVQSYFENLKSKDRNKQYQAYNQLIAEMKKEVDWAYEVWDKLVEDLSSKDAHDRSRAGQFLSYLAISDPENRILEDFDQVWQVTYDEKFVTARHTLQAIWRIALAGEQHERLVVDRMTDRFINGTDEKNYTLRRNDMIQNLYNIYQVTENPEIEKVALSLIELEEDSKYRKNMRRFGSNRTVEIKTRNFNTLSFSHNQDINKCCPKFQVIRS
ncbi:hypothetical protein MUN88_21190 [Gracilibacillus caseinilyticus]|uniref:HEAT repeat-containing protein n=1 Tax=Gracilibacillus caseinilyticus TaxID=2932256 RepID=A0ABY4EWU8_9BACI|nr:hypothetical protein [Gracilibacillus caseinilyticus]UOQ48511.1 hypothetical protein MUN88_21190 [Gracilibacillus caseinilyticus]